MPDFEIAQQNQFEERRGTEAHVLVWIIAKNRDTGLPEAVGFWTGADHRIFIIDGQSRTYFGAGAVIDPGVLRAGIGLDVRYHTVTLPPMLDEVRQALRTFEPRGAEVQLHSIPFDLDQAGPLGTPRRMIKGTLEAAPESLSENDGGTKTELKIASAFRQLTIGIPLLKSNEALLTRNPTDKGREYSDVVGEWNVPWGAID